MRYPKARSSRSPKRPRLTKLEPAQAVADSMLSHDRGDESPRSQYSLPVLRFLVCARDLFPFPLHTLSMCLHCPQPQSMPPPCPCPFRTEHSAHREGGGQRDVKSYPDPRFSREAKKRLPCRKYCIVYTRIPRKSRTTPPRHWPTNPVLGLDSRSPLLRSSKRTSHLHSRYRRQEGTAKTSLRFAKSVVLLGWASATLINLFL